MSTILVVDDIATNRLFLTTLLGHHGHRMLEAADGSEALTVVRAHLPDLVITDVLMPVMDGYEFVKHLHLDPAICDIPVVFYTAHFGAREARELALAGGVSDVLSKPATSAEVLKVVGVLLAAKPSAHVRSMPTPLPAEFDSEHLRLISDKLSEKVRDLEETNARLTTLFSIGFEFASERDTDRLLHRVCEAARELFGATYVTLAIVGRTDRLAKHFYSCGAENCSEGELEGWLQLGDVSPGILNTALLERRTLRGVNASSVPAALELPATHPRIQAFLVAPILSARHAYGWICLVENEGNPFSADDEYLIGSLSGQLGRIYELEHEVMERRQAEWNAADARDRAQRYLDIAEVMLLQLDLTGRVVLINRYACQLLGRSAEEMVGSDFIANCIPERLRSKARAALAGLLYGDSSVVEFPIVSSAGRERMIEWRNTVMRDDRGQANGTFSSGTDITERSEAIAAAHLAEERIQFALESAGVGIWDMDTATGVLHWSSTLESHYGLAAGTFGGRMEDFVERIHPDDRAQMLATIGESMRTGGDFTTAYRTLWADDTVRWLTGAGRVVLGELGQPIRAVGIGLDVTERHLLEDQYQQAQKMEAIGRLAGGVAHDFNNLLTVILGNCELLLADLPPDSACRVDVDGIQTAGQTASRLTRQLLAFSRKQIIEPVQLDLNSAVADMRALCVRLIGEDIQVVMRLLPGTAQIIADRGQLEQIVLNLAVNARDAMPKGGTLTIETSVLVNAAERRTLKLPANAHGYIRLSVIDTGVGMTPDVMSRLFEPFFTTKELGKGTGLGLASVKGMVARIGGTVVVRSELGLGSSFDVYFPVAGGLAAVEEETLPAPTLAAAATILVLEDSDSLRELTRRLLDRLGYAVLVAATGGDALDLLQQHPDVDLFLTDVVMPGPSGPEVARRMVALRPSLRVLYMSGYTDDAIAQHGVLSPGIALLAKPFNMESLGAKVREVLEKAPIAAPLSTPLE